MTIWYLTKWRPAPTSDKAGFEIVKKFGEWGEACEARRASPKLVLREEPEAAKREVGDVVTLAHLPEGDADKHTAPHSIKPPRLGEVEDAVREATFWGGVITTKEVAETLGITPKAAQQALSSLGKKGIAIPERGWRIVGEEEKRLPPKKSA